VHSGLRFAREGPRIRLFGSQTVGLRRGRGADLVGSRSAAAGKYPATSCWLWEHVDFRAKRLRPPL
jgi:hypothetical protein